MRRPAQRSVMAKVMMWGSDTPSWVPHQLVGSVPAGNPPPPSERFSGLIVGKKCQGLTSLHAHMMEGCLDSAALDNKHGTNQRKPAPPMQK